MGVARKQFRVFGKPIKHIFKRPQPRFEPQNYEADVLTALHRYTNYVSPNLMLIFFNMQEKKIMCVWQQKAICSLYFLEIHGLHWTIIKYDWDQVAFIGFITQSPPSHLNETVRFPCANLKTLAAIGK